MERRAFLLLNCLLGMILACNTLTPSGQPTPSTQATARSTASSTPPATLPATPIPSPDAWACFACPVDQLWLLDPDGARQVDVPTTIGQYYDYDPPSQRILYASHFASEGAGPSTIAASDLRTMDLGGGQPMTWIAEDTVVEALWMPDGQSIVYVQATSDTYELRLMSKPGDSQLLAIDVAFTFAPSPDRTQIAFTRESRYQPPGEPGLYVVDIATGEERQVSQVDRAGMGGSADMPLWSPDGQYILLPASGDQGISIELARSDGGFSAPLDYSQMDADKDWTVGPDSSLLWGTDSGSLLTMAYQGEIGMGAGLVWLVQLTLDPQRGLVTGGTTLGKANGLIGWQQRGESLWILAEGDNQPVLIGTSG